MCLFGWTADRDAAFVVLDAFIAAHGDFIDTADGYSAWAPGNSGGESEQLIGEWLRDRGARDRVTIATKVSSHPDFRGLAAENVRAAADASLQRLGVERIDLYYAHFDDAETPLEETVAAFAELVDAGKVREVGLSNYAPERIEEWFRIARDAGYRLPVALQPHYNLVERGYETNGLREVAEREGLAVFPYYGLASGFLAGKYRHTAGVENGTSPRAGAAAQYLDARGRRVLETLDSVAAAHGVELATVALAWLAARPTISAPIASARTPEQLPALLASVSLRLAPEEIEELTTASAVDAADPVDSGESVA